MDLYHAQAEGRIRTATDEDMTGQIDLNKLVATNVLRDTPEPVNVAEAQAFAEHLWSAFADSSAASSETAATLESRPAETSTDSDIEEVELIDLAVLSQAS